MGFSMISSRTQSKRPVTDIVGIRKTFGLNPDSVRAQMDSCSFTSDGGLTEWEDARACEEAIVTEQCGTLPDVYGSIEVLESNASVSLTIDGNEDLLQAFDGLTLDDLLALE